jgi:multiple sugar transport system ATP-binding protein
MNLFPATVSAGQLVLEDGQASGLTAPGGAREGQKLLIGKRPEEIALGPEGSLEATVENIEPTGSETFLELKLGSQLVSAVLRERPWFEVGSFQRISLGQGAVHLFDAGDRRQRLFP